MLRNLLLLILFLSFHVIFAQVGIGTTNPDASAIFELKSTDKGVLLPRMNTTERDAINSPASGLMIFNTSSHCLEINNGTDSAPNWECMVSSTVGLDCDLNSFEGSYLVGTAFTAANKFSVTITNNGTSTADFTFTNADVSLSGVPGVSVISTSPASVTLVAGGSQLVEYTLSGTPSSTGEITAIWAKDTKSCSKTIEVKGNATFSLPRDVYVISINDVSPATDLQGIIDNGSNQIVVSIPYTSGNGTYDAYTSTYVLNGTGTGEGGDANSFRLSYSSGTFSTSGNINVTIEVDGDGSFNAEKQAFGIEKVIANLDFQVNGGSKGFINLNVLGGILDRNFADANHKFIYAPVTAADGNVWLNNNLGANYSNANHVEFDVNQQATSYFDHHANGSIFQWGRNSDGHELINHTGISSATPVNGSTSVNATTDNPGHGMYITETGLPRDWRVPKNDLLWQGEAGTNNPCPSGYRVPTTLEFTTMVAAENITNTTTAASSSLAMTRVGSRTAAGGTMSYSVTGYYLSTIDGDRAQYFQFQSFGPSLHNATRASGHGVRCIKD